MVDNVNQCGESVVWIQDHVEETITRSRSALLVLIRLASRVCRAGKGFWHWLFLVLQYVLFRLYCRQVAGWH